MLPGEQTQECAHESSHMTSSYPRHNNLASFTAGPAECSPRLFGQ
jgi:hypothetical protein